MDAHQVKNFKTGRVRVDVGRIERHTSSRTSVKRAKSDARPAGYAIDIVATVGVDFATKHITVLQ